MIPIVRPGVVQGVYELVDVLSQRVRELEKELHKTDRRRSEMSVREEAMSLLRVVFKDSNEPLSAQLLQDVVEWLLKHDGRVLYSDGGDE